ncbi:MAG TPA: BatA domain-containing protein [Cyclobacteriaceae bacterium]|nr:BatA domain-containing protein [Cyclobacteriaceae bacterium]
MTFLYPQFLFALAALGIPVIIHLFNFRKARQVYFSSTQFLHTVRQSTSSKLKLKHLLVLLCRLLVILFLVITFSQPVVPGKENMGEGETACIYFDNSMSMSNLIDNNVNGLEGAIFITRDIIKAFPRNMKYVFLTNDFLPFSNSPKSSDDLDRNLSQLTFSPQSRSFEEVYNRIRSLSGGNSGNNIYWISDFQASTFGARPQVRIDSTDHLYLIPLEFQEETNVYVDTVYLDNPFLIQGEKNKLNIILKLENGSGLVDMPVRLFVNGLQVTNASLNLEPGRSSRISFDINFPLQSVNHCRLNFDDFPVDFDNDYYFILNLSDRINISEIKSAARVTVIEKVYGNKELFNFKSYDAGNLDYNFARSADLLVLNELGTVDRNLMGLIRDFYDRGGTLFLIPARAPVTAGFELNGIRLVPTNDSIPTIKPLADPDLSDPFFSEVFESTSERFSMPQATELYNSPSSNVLLKFRDGRSFLSKINNAILLSCPLAPEFTDFQNNALFVPIMYRMAMLSKKSFNRLSYTMGESLVSYRIDSLGAAPITRLVSDKKEIIPAQRISGNDLILDIPKSELDAGIYNIANEGLPGGAVAFNYGKQESVLKQFEENELMNFFGENSNIRVFNIKDINKFDQVLKDNYLGKSYWKYALILAMIFLLAEVLLLRFL